MTLALFGGAPARSRPFPAWPDYDDGERTALIRALEQGQWWRMGGTEVASFETEFAAYHGAHSALAVSNGTHAIEVALMALGVGPGDEVMVPAFTFISTSMAVQRVGATPIPVDVDLGTYGMDPECVESSLSDRTRVIMPVHMAGNAVDMNLIGAIAERRDITVIQDAAHAHGMISDNKRLGEWGSMACLSFQNFKLMTAGEGGAILFPDEELRERAFLYHNCGRHPQDRVYDHSVVGSNFRIGEFAAAVLREQLKRLTGQNERRERNAALLYSELVQIDGITVQQRSSGTNLHPHYMVMFRVTRPRSAGLGRDDLVKALIAEGIPAFIAYRPIYRTDAFHVPPGPQGGVEYWARSCPNTEKIGAEAIWLHHRILLGDESDVMDVVAAVRKVMACRPALQSA